MSDDIKLKKTVLLKLRDIRREKGLTMSTLAEKSGLDPQKIGRVERGETKLTIPMLRSLAGVLDVSVQQLLEDSTLGESSNEDSVNLIPVIYEKFEELFSKHNIIITSSTKVYLATILFRGIEDIRISAKGDENVVKALFQVLDAIFERIVLSS